MRKWEISRYPWPAPTRPDPIRRVDPRPAVSRPPDTIHPTTMALAEPDTRLGPYRIVDLLGVGGMGEVYRARDERLNRLVAVKVLPADRVAASAERRSRFIQEAQLASALQHPNIVTIFDIGSTEVGDYLAMELVRGRTLDDGHPAGRPAAAERAALRQPDRRRPRRGPCRRHRSPRPQAGQHHGDRAGPDQGPRLRARHAGRRRSHQRRPTRPAPAPPPSKRERAPSSARSPTCRRSRRRGTPSTRAPTSSRSARSSTRCCPACARSAAGRPSGRWRP